MKRTVLAASLLLVVNAFIFAQVWSDPDYFRIKEQQRDQEYLRSKINAQFWNGDFYYPSKIDALKKQGLYTRVRLEEHAVPSKPKFALRLCMNKFNVPNWYVWAEFDNHIYIYSCLIEDGGKKYYLDTFDLGLLR